MHLMVAGCSFSAVSQTLPGTSWSEVLASKLGWQLTNMARQGCSNGGIRIQIEEIRRQRPTFAIVTPTFWDRMEIPASAAPYLAAKNENLGWGNDLQLHLQDRNLKNGYDPAAGLDNINYGTNHHRMICETIFSLAQNGPHAYRSGPISKQAQNAVKHYIDSMYDSNWKKQQDEWIIREGIMQLYLDGINFIVSPVLLWPFDQHNQAQWRTAFPQMIPDRNIMLAEKESVMPLTGNNPFEGADPGYHSNPHAQTLIAHNWYQRITEQFKLA